MNSDDTSAGRLRSQRPARLGEFLASQTLGRAKELSEWIGFEEAGNSPWRIAAPDCSSGVGSPDHSPRFSNRPPWYLTRLVVWITICIALLQLLHTMALEWAAPDSRVFLALGFQLVFAGSALLVVRSQPLYAMFFAVAASLITSRDLAVYEIRLFWLVPCSLFLILLVEWSRDQHQIRRYCYLVGLGWSTGLFLTDAVVGLGDGLGPVWPWTIVFSLVLHSERCALLGFRRTARASIIVGSFACFFVSGVLFSALGHDADVAMHKAFTALLLLSPGGCLLFEWAHRRRLRLSSAAVADTHGSKPPPSV